MVELDGLVLLADSMGIGKTIQVLTYIKDHVPKGPSVVVCPASLKYNWKREARVHVGIRAVVLSGRTPPKGTDLRTDKRVIYVVNYDILGGWVKLLLQARPVLIAADECHAIKGRTTKRTKAVRALCRKVPRRVMVSGTPLTNRPAELWSALNMVRPDLYPSFMSFAMAYCKPEKKPWGWEYKGAKDLPRLHAELTANLMIRRRKEDVLKDLPPKIRTVVPLDMDPAGAAEYAKARDDFVHWLRTTDYAKATAARKAERLSRFGHLKRLAGTGKLTAALAWVEDWLAESDGKIILFGVHKKVLSKVTARYPTAAFVDGSVTGKDRQKAFDKFQTDPRCRVFAGNIQAAGTGWNGTAAEAVAFLELDWAPSSHTQGEARADRIGQVRPVNCYYLVARGTVEAPLCKMIESKQAVLDVTLDGAEHADSLDVYSELERSLLAGDLSVPSSRRVRSPK